MATTTNHDAAVAALVETAQAGVKAESAGAKLSAALSLLYVEMTGDEAAFVAEFGNGLNPQSKDYVAGRFADDVKLKLKGKPEAVKKSIANTLKARLSEVRKLRRAGGMPGKDESIQKAIKRYASPSSKGAKPEGNATETKVAIADDASLEDIADALSIWVGKHSTAAKALAAKLPEFLPVSLKKSRAA